MNSPERLTIVTVSYHYEKHLTLNIGLARKLNPRSEIKWVIADNSHSAEAEGFAADNFEGEDVEIIEGIPPMQVRDAGSLHHGLAVNLALKKAKTRFVLVLDPDLFIMRENWISEVIAHMKEKNLTFFGSVWHPKWTTHFRYFPSVHCFFADTSKIPAKELDFTPELFGGPYVNMIAAAKIPGNVKRMLLTGRYKDTGWKIFDKFGKDPDVLHETLVPYYHRPAAPKFLEAAVDSVMKIARRGPVMDTKPGYYSRESTVPTNFDKIHEWGWEEFQWENRLFAIHMRNVARRHLGGVDVDSDLKMLIEILRQKKN